MSEGINYFIKIDKSSIKSNPEGGKTDFIIPGACYTDENGNMSRSFQRVQTLTPEPYWFYDYEEVEVECYFCNTKFYSKELNSEWVEWFSEDGEEATFVENMCPNCKTGDCCEIEYEKIDKVLKEEGLK